jgi:hypothetical protein
VIQARIAIIVPDQPATMKVAVDLYEGGLICKSEYHCLVKSSFAKSARDLQPKVLAE